MDRDLAAFFAEIFGINVGRSDLPKDAFPTFEEVLGLTDLAIMRKEAFRKFDMENRVEPTRRLRLMAEHLVFLVAKILDAKLGTRGIVHRQLTRNLRDTDQLRHVAFVSTNYDILIDNALTEEHRHFDLDYGVEFSQFRLG